MRTPLPRKATQYIFFEIIPSLILGVLVFIFILLMAQALRYTEFVLIHGVGIGVVGQIIMYLSISFLPALLPMSLLFAVIMTYGRLSNDSEIIAFKACGMSMVPIAFPAFLLSALVTLISAQTSFHLAPWGNRQFEILISKVGSTKASVAIREGTFSEGFFDKVVYANQVSPDTGELKSVFIYDETQGDLPLTIIAKKGQIIQDPKVPNSVLIRLFNGDIHRKGETHTKIQFDSYDIKITNPVHFDIREKSPQSMTIEEISENLRTKKVMTSAEDQLLKENKASPEQKEALKSKLSPEQALMLKVEYHKRWAISLVCLIFGLLGVALGTNTNRRNQKANGLVLSLGVVVTYWILYISGEGFARSGQLPPAVAIWIPNVLFAIFAAVRLRKIWN